MVTQSPYSKRFMEDDYDIRNILPTIVNQANPIPYYPAANALLG